MNQLSEFQIVYATCDQIYKAEEISRILLGHFYKVEKVDWKGKTQEGTVGIWL
jgi:hypothetical protein